MSLLDKHRTLLAEAVSALSTRSFWSPFPEIPSSRTYVDTAQTEGQVAAEALFQSDYPLDQPGDMRRVATEQSPYPDLDGYSLSGVRCRGLAQGRWRGRAELAGRRAGRMFYDPKQRHGTAGDTSPAEFERRHSQRLKSG